VGVAGALVAVGNPVSYVSDKADQFTSLSGGNESGATRLGSVGGQRYDLWRVAVEEWKDHPVAGVGESGYASPYYLLRRTERNLVSAHSLPFSILAELGTVGVLLFLGFLVSAALALVRPLREASREDRRRVAALAALAAVFLGQAIVDWFWIIPGLTGLVMLSLGTAIALLHPASAGGPRRAALRWAPAAVCGVLALLAATQLVSAVKLEDARAARTQQARLDAARQAERFNPYALAPRYAQAGALEALGRRDEARRELEDALALEPTSFVTLGLLGDLEVRAGDPRAARRWYRRALALNPRDRGLRLLVRQAR
jgi:O-antigen ligase